MSLLLVFSNANHYSLRTRGECHFIYWVRGYYYTYTPNNSKYKKNPATEGKTAEGISSSESDNEPGRKQVRKSSRGKKSHVLSGSDTEDEEPQTQTSSPKVKRSENVYQGLGKRRLMNLSKDNESSEDSDKDRSPHKKGNVRFSEKKKSDVTTLQSFASVSEVLGKYITVLNIVSILILS